MSHVPFTRRPVSIVHSTPRAATVVALADPTPADNLHPLDTPDRADYTPVTVLVYLAADGEICTTTVDGGGFGASHADRVDDERAYIATYGGTVLHTIEGEFDSAYGRTSVWTQR